MDSSTTLQQQLLDAAKQGNAALVQRLLETAAATASPKRTTTSQNTTTTHIINCCNEFGETPLHLATLRRHVNVVQVLLDSPYPATAHVNAVTHKEGKSPLFLAARDNQMEIATLLLHKGQAQVDLPNTQSGVTPLIIATLNNHRAMVQLLLQAGANILHTDKKGHTCLENALLLDPDQWNPLTRDLALTLNLVQACGPANNNNHTNTKTALENLIVAAASNRRSPPTTKPTTLPTKSTNGSSRKTHSNTNGLFAHVKIPNNNAGEYLIHVACRVGSTVMVQALLQTSHNNSNNVDVLLHATTATGQTPLMLAARGGHFKVVKMLLLQKSNNLRLTSQDWDGHTVLHHACLGGHAPLVYFLVGAAATSRSVNLESIMNHQGEAALDLARRVAVGNQEIVKFLE